VQRRGQGRHELVILAQRHTIGELVEVGGIDRDFRRVPCGDQVSDGFPLIGLFIRVPSRFEQPARSACPRPDRAESE
jgi:hypothetical protein